MELLRKWLGPRSKYDDTIPYTYQARLPIPELEETYDTYQADTICALIQKLHEEGIAPDEVEIYEEYQGRETLIKRAVYTAEGNRWVFKPELCHRFESEYPGHIQGEDCSFKDRDKRGQGPF